MPLLPIEEEGRLEDPTLRENFVERIFGHARWRKALSRGMRRGDLLEFHDANKLAILAHSPASWKRLGWLAGVEKGSAAASLAEYGRGFMEALRVPATRGRHASVLSHMLGYLKEVLPPAERVELAEAVSGYARGIVPFVVPLTLFRHHVWRYGIAELAGQTYLDPDPRELMLKNRP
jgi:uncharacterized protein YbgA (DUF1722 family)